MSPWLLWSCLLALLALRSPQVAAFTIPKAPRLNDRQLLSPSPYSLPSNGLDSLERSLAIVTKQAGYLYGPAVAGGPYFPTGVLGLARVAADQADLQLDLVPELALSALDATDGTASVLEYNGLQTLEDYTLLYDGHLKNTLPNGPVPGVLTNYTQDLLFSMERLSISPYQVVRLNPSSDTLQFTIDDDVATNITGMTLQSLFEAGRLFYADYRDQQTLTPTLQYSAACDAFFYIDPTSGDFLPLAIRTNVGSNLIYTPNDEPDDWLLAKIMYNVNDFWFAQWNHLASTHEVVQIAYLAAIRTLSDEHPVLAILNRLMYEVYAVQPIALAALFLPGTAVDLVFPYTGTSAQDYTTNRYANGGSGRFEANYFTSDLEARGLLNSAFGPALKNFPFYEDGSTIYAAINTFMTSFVDSYYSSDADVAADKEMQAWVKEAQGPAKAIDFPSISTKSALIAALSHVVSTQSPSPSHPPPSHPSHPTNLPTPLTRRISPQHHTTPSTPMSSSPSVPPSPSTRPPSTNPHPPQRAPPTSPPTSRPSSRSKNNSPSQASSRAHYWSTRTARCCTCSTTRACWRS